MIREMSNKYGVKAQALEALAQDSDYSTSN